MSLGWHSLLNKGLVLSGHHRKQRTQTPRPNLPYPNRMWCLPSVHAEVIQPNQTTCLHLYFRVDVTPDGKEQWIIDRELLIIAITRIIRIHHILLIYGMLAMLKNWREMIKLIC